MVMRQLALVVVLLSMPAFAADYTPWTKDEPGASPSIAQTVEGYCCRHCRPNEQPCGRTCIAAKAICKEKPGGCACPSTAP